eukprot:SAG22_NODE_7468_length_736_cov_1.543171_2_plen_53_part_01
MVFGSSALLRSVLSGTLPLLQPGPRPPALPRCALSPGQLGNCLTLLVPTTQRN